MTSAFVRARRRQDGATLYSVLVKELVRGKWCNRTVASRIGSRREADRIKREVEAKQKEIRAGVSKDTPTVGALLDAYEHSLAGRPSLEGVQRVARLHLRPALEDVQIGNLTRPAVQELANERRAAGLGPQSLRHVVGTLRASINNALRTGLYDGHNVADKVALPRVTRTVKETLTLSEAAAVLAQIPETFRPFAATAIYAGLRPGELVGLRVENVDLCTRMLTIRQSHDRDVPKDGDERRVPIAGALVPFLEEALKHAKGGRVFPADRGGNKAADRKTTRMLRAAMVRAAALGCDSLVTGWTMKCRRCGHQEETETFIEKACPLCRFALWPVGHPRFVRWYDLRHTSATLLVEAGVDPAVVSEVLGHHDPEFTMRTYVRLSADKLRAGIDRVALPEVTDKLGAPVVPMKRRTQ